MNWLRSIFTDDGLDELEFDLTQDYDGDEGLALIESLVAGPTNVVSERNDD